ncbi:MAG TPA: TonB-dependent receptor [Marinagarivorans sp.]
MHVGFSLSLLSLAVSSVVQAQEVDISEDVVAPSVMEEVVIFGRMVSGAESLVQERQEQAVATDYIGAEQIGRIGDSTVAMALTRVPGVTLIDGKFVFVRGLGERYSSTMLNNAMVPSPDLSRNVLPLDIFPTSIVESLAVQKVASADKPAAFGGGSVDIRTTGIPEDLVFSIELGTGLNNQSSDFYTYSGGGDDSWGKDDGTRALPAEISAALDRYRGNFTPGNIRDLTNTDLDGARALNRDLIVSLNRDISIAKESGDPDMSAEINFGNNFTLPNDMEIGFLAGAAYDSQWRNSKITQRKIADPDNLVVFEEESSFSVGLTGNFSVGVRLNSENKVETTSLFIRNTDDEVARIDYFNANFLLEDGRGLRNDSIRYEQRELEVHQIHGEHELGSETIDFLGLEALSFLQGATLNWYISDSEASTDLPSETVVQSDITANPQTGAATSSSVARNDSSVANFRFTQLRDFVDSQGFSVSVPFSWKDFDLKLNGGTDYWQKARAYEQFEFFLGSTFTGPDPSIYNGPLGSVFSDENMLNPENGFLIGTNPGNANSYVAANKVNAAFGQIDLTWDDTLRLVAGSRWEDYQQVNLPWNPINYDGSQFPGAENENPEIVADYFRDATYQNADNYNSAALTWMLQDFWADDFQLRFSFAETTVRPDLREISDSSYRDPITDISMNGNPNVIPSQMHNYDLRAEWFFGGGDNFTASLFYKDITDPIELFEGAATDDNITAEIHNAESAKLFGIELEFLKTLGSVADVLDPFFIQGNFTFMDQELKAGNSADAPTNMVRPLQGASDQVANLILGFDAPDGMHAATLSYNVFSERLFFAGRNGAPDSFEQPFHSLDMTYSFYPADNFTVKFKVRNLLDQDFTIAADRRSADGSVSSIDLYTKEVGQDFSLSVQYTY